MKRLRKIPVLVAIAAATVLNAHASNAADGIELSQYGIGSVTKVTRKASDKVRGRGFSNSVSGMSFISGMLYDPNTGSSITAVDTNHSKASSQGIAEMQSSLQQHAGQLGLNLNISSNGSTFGGSLQGLAGGFSFSGFPQQWNPPQAQQP